MSIRTRNAAVVTLALVTVLTACCSQDSRPPGVDTASADLADHGGARRLTGDRSQALREAIDPGVARNVILLIGDGMGDSEITMARNYVHGAAGSFAGLDALPLTGQVTTYALRKDGKPAYVTDSAAGASAWSTGTKTYPGALSVDIHGTPQPTLLELAKAAGLATGDVSTAAIQDATPAAQYAHLPSRRCYGPVQTARYCPADARERGGPGSITEQLVAARPDVTLGGGAQTFAQVTGGQTLAVQAKQRGYQLIHTADELAAAAKADQSAPVLGLFDDGDLPPRWTGPAAVRQGYLQPAITCTENPEHGAQIPTLAAMTSKAIDLLDAGGHGFFLQVEGASIDKQSHGANPCGQIGETVDFDEAVRHALDFARADGHTLVVVSADHGHAGQIVEPVTEDDVRGIAADNRLPAEQVRDVIYPGLSRVLVTADGAEMTVSYGLSADLRVQDQGHSGTQVRIGGYGPRAANVVALTDQTDLFTTVADALGLDRGAS